MGTNTEEQVEEYDTCDNCGYPTIDLKETKKYSGEVFNLCRICFGTFLGHASIYPNQVSDDKLYKSIAYVTNMILDEIEEIKNGKQN